MQARIYIRAVRIPKGHKYPKGINEFVPTIF
jgi:hypothetical protein